MICHVKQEQYLSIISCRSSDASILISRNSAQLFPPFPIVVNTLLHIATQFFTNSGFQETPINTTWSDGSSARTVIYTRDPRTALYDQCSVLQDFDDFIFRPSLMSTLSDGTPFQTSPMHTAHFQNVYKFIRQSLFNCNDNTVF